MGGKGSPGPGFACAMGLGVRVVVDESVGLLGSAGTFSWNGLAGTSYWVDPAEDLVAMFLPQMIPGPPGMPERFRTLGLSGPGLNPAVRTA